MKIPTLSSFIASIAIASACTVTLTQTAAAFDATATTAVNVRSGPGGSYSKVDVLSFGEAVNIRECEGNWCYIEHSGPDGWVSGKYLQADGNGASSQSNNQQVDPALAAILGAILGAVINNAHDNDDPTPPTPPPPTYPTYSLENGTYTVQVASNGRYLDAGLTSSDDFRVVTNAQNNPSARHRWMFKRKSNGTYTIRHRKNLQYMDAYEGSHDHSIMTRPAQGNSTQEWILNKLPNGNFTIRQRSSGRLMDNHEGTDVVTRNAQSNGTQQWRITRETAQPAPPVPQSENFTGLYLYYSSQRGDNFSTATAKGIQAATGAGYRLVRKQGCILTEQLPGTVPLELYWHGDRGDNLTTATGAQDARNAGYQFVRTLGYIYASPSNNKLPLRLHWSVARGDNFTSATSRGASDARAANYRSVRNEGYIEKTSFCD